MFQNINIVILNQKGFSFWGAGGKRAGLYNFALLSRHISIWAFLSVKFGTKTLRKRQCARGHFGCEKT